MPAMKRTFRDRAGRKWWWWRRLADRLKRRTPQIAGTPVTTATNGVAYAGFTVAGDHGKTPYAYSIAAGALPTGITLNTSTGAVTGTPSVTGTFAGIVIRVTDDRGNTADLPAFTIIVGA
jgi:hypothetical protein